MNGASPLNNPTPRLRVAAVVGLSVLVVGCVLLGWYADWSWFPFPTMPAGALTPFQPVDDGPRLPGAYTHDTGHYAGLAALPSPEMPPVTTPLPSFSLPTLPPVPATPSPTTTTGTGRAQAVVPQTRGAQAPLQATAGVKKPKWEYLAKAEASAAVGTPPQGLVAPEATPGRVHRTQGQDQQGAGRAQALIQHAQWAIPAEPLKTLYASQVIAARTETAINSSIPGRVILRTTIPTLDKFHYGTVIIPKDTLLVAAQETQQVQFGETRIAVRLKQAEFPSGEIVDLRATIGDEQGAQGLTGKVRNQYGKILLAAGINALISLGGNSLAGTPTGFYPNPVQQSIREASQSVSQDARTIVQKQLQVAPVITVPAQTNVSIVLEENVQFSLAPLVIK